MTPEGATSQGGAHPASLSDEALLDECTMRRGRTSGPGGQHRNKVETQVTLTHGPTGIGAQAGERRTPEDNRKVALQRLRLALAVQVREAPGDAPSTLWCSRRKGTKIVVSAKHRDFPSIIAEALDALAAAGWEPRGAADYLGCSASQLIKLVKQHPQAFGRINQERQKLGRHVLK